MRFGGHEVAKLWLAKPPSFASYLRLLARPLNKFIHFARWVGRFWRPLLRGHPILRTGGHALRRKKVKSKSTNEYS